MSYEHHGSVYHRSMTTATAQAAPNIPFIIFTLAKLGQTNRKVCFASRVIPCLYPFSQIIKTNITDKSGISLSSPF